MIFENIWPVNSQWFREHPSLTWPGPVFSCVQTPVAEAPVKLWQGRADLPVIFTLATSGKHRHPPTLAGPSLCCFASCHGCRGGAAQCPVTGTCTFAHRWDVCHCSKLLPGMPSLLVTKALMIHFDVWADFSSVLLCHFLFSFPVCVPLYHSTHPHIYIVVLREFKREPSGKATQGGTSETPKEPAGLFTCFGWPGACS